MSFDLADRFNELSVSTPIIVPLNKKKLNICYSNTEFSSFDYFKRSSRILLNHKDLTLFGLKAGSLVKIQQQNILIRNLFEVWPSVLTKPNDVTFGVLNLKTWLDIEIGEKVDLLPIYIDKTPVLTANKIQIRYYNYNSNIPKPTEHILHWIKANNIFGESCRNFVTIGNEEIYFQLNVIDSADSSSEFYRFVQNKTIFEEANSSPKISTTKFGGLQTQFDEMVKLAELFLKPNIPLIYSELKLSHGILLYGPPGCGKTLLVRNVADFVNVPVIHLTASDLYGIGYGEAEKKLLHIFESAKKLSASIIFMDEIDSLCPKRDSNISASSLRITTLLLTLMDGCYDSANESKILFIGATNMPNSLDPALRRPGRFDREIEISPPSSQDRYAILRNILENYPNDINFSDLKNISDISHGYVGSDLNLICKEAFMIATKKLDDFSRYAVISISDMQIALSKIRPSAMREVFIEVPKVKWSDIGGQKSTKQKLVESVEWPIKYPDRFEKLGIKPPKGILLFGPPGCSKTLLAKALASESGLNFLAVKGPEIFSKYIGESEKKIRDIFKKARQASPAIVFFDEFDSIAGRSDGDAGISAVSDRVISQLLNEMDGLEPLVNVIIIAATNKPDLIDKALLRPGRFDRHIYISPPDFKGRLEILQILLKRMPFNKGISPETLAELTEGFSGAEIVSICQNSAIKCIERDITNLEIEWEDINFSLANFEKQISCEFLKVYEKFIK